ncbi:hypothetical protein TL16_g06249 [Triparma laevis f. inornata]|uniref:NECAP PHear domain-containing protein n=1 Tax=Triparma laevis f. inornata TaxID=1714386 RepID=A0A9W7ATI1_9STRA|nr:hypothetical protein TL16_g06249 [Triparma laevis f. inornata]
MAGLVDTTSADTANIAMDLMDVDEVFVYFIPKLTSSTGHRADSWSLDKPALTGKFTLSHYETSNILHISLLEPSGSLFARCPINLNGTPPKLLDTVVETVLDSSRYFVLLCVDDATKREVRVGIGFRDRTHASDLKGHLQDYVRSIERQNKAKELKAPPPANLTEIEKGVEGIKVGEGQKKEEVVEEDEDWGDFEGA